MDEGGEPPRTRSRSVPWRWDGKQFDEKLHHANFQNSPAPSRNLAPLLGTGEGPFLDVGPSTLDSFDRAKKKKVVALFLDYDGTLSPIEDDPGYAFMPEAMRTIVRSVAGYFPTAIISGRSRHKVNRENVLPLSWKDLGKTPLEEKALNWEAFLSFTRGSVLNIPPKYHGALLLLCGSFLSYQAKNLTAPFDFPFGKSSNTPQSLLSFGEAFEAFFPEMAHITKFMICYFLTSILVLPLQPGVQIFCMLLLISAPLFYFPELVRKASVVDVACGSFKLPLIWFATFGALGLSLICGLVTLLMAYLSWRFIYKGKPRVNELEVSLDGLSEVLGG